MIQSLLSKSHFEDDGTQNSLLFQTVSYNILLYFETVSANNSNILTWMSKGLPDESIKPPTISDKMFNPSLDFFATKARVKFNGGCLK